MSCYTQQKCKGTDGAKDLYMVILTDLIMISAPVFDDYIMEGMHTQQVPILSLSVKRMLSAQCIDFVSKEFLHSITVFIN